MQASYGCRPRAVALVDSSGQIRAGLPVADRTSPFGKRSLISLPYTDHCQPLGQDDADASALAQYLLQSHDTRLELRWDYPANPQLHTRPAYLLHRVPLQASFETTIRSIHTMHQRNARTAQKRGVEVMLGQAQEHLRTFYSLHVLTRQRLGVPVQPWKFFQHLGDQLLARDLGFVLLASQAGQPVAGAVFLHWNKTLTYKFGASDPAHLNLRPNDLLFWEATRWGCEHGFDTLDMGRTDFDNPGLAEFKRRWGAQELQISYTYSYEPAPYSAVDRLMPIAGKLIRSLPPWFCRMVGELLYRFAS